MVIAKYAIEDFLDRPLRDSARAKKFTSRALDAKFASLQPPPKFHTPLRKHQKVGFLLGVKYPAYVILFDTGLGKSKLMLDLFSYARRKARYEARQAGSPLPPALRMLVLVPGTSNVGQWVTEVKTHAPHLSVAGVDVSGSAERMLLVKGESDIVVLTYMGFLALVCSGKVVLDPKTGEPKQDKDGDPITKGWQLDKKKLRVFQKLFGFWVGDESTHFRLHKTLVYRACKAMAWACPYRYALTGTPHGKKVEALWSQFHVIDKGETLGPTLGLFRAALFNTKDNFWSGGVDYTFDERKKRILNRMLRHGSIRYRKSECLDLPPKVPTIRPVVFDKETWTYYDRLVQEIQASRGAFEVVDSAFRRMRALTAGYLPLKDSEGHQQVIRFKRAPKIEAVVEFVQEVIGESKVVLFHEYKLTGEAVCEALKRAKIRHRWLYSGAKRKGELVQQFLTDPEVRVMVSSSAGAYGGNWQVANYIGFVESPTDPITRTQEEDRIHRMGQTKTSFIYDFTVMGSIDEKILKSLASGRNLFRDIVEGGGPDLARAKPRVMLKE